MFRLTTKYLKVRGCFFLFNLEYRLLPGRHNHATEMKIPCDESINQSHSKGRSKVTRGQHHFGKLARYLTRDGKMAKIRNSWKRPNILPTTNRKSQKFPIKFQCLSVTIVSLKEYATDKWRDTWMEETRQTKCQCVLRGRGKSKQSTEGYQNAM